MSLIRPATHRLLDWVTVAAFAVAPFALGLTGLPAYLAWALAGVHLGMTLLTAFPGGPARPVPLRLHGVVELLVGPVLILAPFALGWTGAARWFYMIAGLVILAVRFSSSYGAATPPPAGETGAAWS